MFRIKVKEVAESKGISQRQLFLRSGVDITTIRRLFRYPDTVVTVETLTRLAKILEVDVSTLIESVPDQLDVENVPDRPNTKKVRKRPNAKSVPDQPDTKSVPDQPDVKSVPDQSDNAPTS